VKQTQGVADGSWGGGFHPEFGPQPGDVVLLEHRAQSGFANTDLDVQLEQRGRSMLFDLGGKPMHSERSKGVASAIAGGVLLLLSTGPGPRVRNGTSSARPITAAPQSR
jgi:hypothetical protein